MHAIDDINNINITNDLYFKPRQCSLYNHIINVCGHKDKFIWEITLQRWIKQEFVRETIPIKLRRSQFSTDELNFTYTLEEFYNKIELLAFQKYINLNR